MIGQPDFLTSVRYLRMRYPVPPQKYRLPLIDREPFGEEEIAAALEALICGPVSMGPRVAAFEAKFAEMHGHGEAVFCNSGSSANLLAISALHLKPGDEVIVPAVTWSTTIWPIIQCGGTPVLVDVDPETLCMDEQALCHAMNDKTRAVFIVHLLGNTSNATARAIHNGIPVIEDCCEALGSEYGGRPVGTWGRMGTYSFYLSHHLTTIEGGMVLCRSAQDANRLRVMRSHGWTRHLPAKARQALEGDYPWVDPRFLFVDTGYNLRGTDLQAAIGLVQIERSRCGLWDARRQEIARIWTEGLNQNVFQPVRWSEGAVPFAFPLVGIGKWPRQALLDHLEAESIETRPIVAGNLARQPAMKRLRWKQAGPLIGADVLHERGLYVGLHPDLTDGQVAHFLEALGRFKP